MGLPVHEHVELTGAEADPSCEIFMAVPKHQPAHVRLVIGKSGHTKSKKISLKNLVS